MSRMRLKMLEVGLLLASLSAIPFTASAQWLDYPTPGIPRTADGKADLKAPVPRTQDGKPDLSGMWFANVPSKDYCRTPECIQEERMAREQINLGIKLKDGLPYTQWAKDQMVPRRDSSTSSNSSPAHAGLAQKPSFFGKKTVAHVVQRDPSKAGSGPVVNHPSTAGLAVIRTPEN